MVCFSLKTSPEFFKQFKQNLFSKIQFVLRKGGEKNTQKLGLLFKTKAKLDFSWKQLSWMKQNLKWQQLLFFSPATITCKTPNETLKIEKSYSKSSTKKRTSNAINARTLQMSKGKSNHPGQALDDSCIIT